MSTKQSPLPFWIVADFLLVILAIVSPAYFARRSPERAVSLDSPSSSPVSTPSASPVVTATASASADPTPSASASVSATPSEPASVSSLVARFYAAYKSKDASALAGMFTPDTTSDLVSLHDRLFTGVDADGVPGGPTLFQTNSAGDTATGYAGISAVPQGSGWLVQQREQRVDLSGSTVSPVITELHIVPGTAAGTWLIDAYTYQNTSGKYDAFIVQ